MSYCRSAFRRSAFTVIELVVVLAIVLLVAGWFLIAVHQVRQSAKRMVSLGHLKQIAIALHVCEDAHGRLPPAIGFYPMDAPPAANKDWLKVKPASHGTLFFHILPYIEQLDEFKNSEGMSRNCKGKFFSTFIAPADFTVPANRLLADNQGAISYAANGVVFGGWTVGVDMMPGPGPQSRVSINDVVKKDGASHTLAIAERYARCIAPMNMGGKSVLVDFQRAWSEDGKGRTPHSAVVWKADVLPQFGAVMQPGPADPAGTIVCNPETFQACAGQSIQVAMFDGSLRTVHAKIKPATWGTVMRHDDGLAPGKDW